MLGEIALDDITIFTTNVTPFLQTFLDDDFNYETTLRRLDNLQEQQRVLQIKDREVRNKTLVNKLFTRLVLNYVSHRITGNELQPWKPPKFQYNQWGKPQLEVNGEQLQFNASTSNRLLSIVVERSARNSAVGIDLSHVKQRISPTTFMDEFSPMFHDSERVQLARIGDGDRYFAFNHLWTLKEAFTKYLGTGLNVDLSLFAFDLGHGMDQSVKRVATPLGPATTSLDFAWYDTTIDTREFVHEDIDGSEIYCRSCVYSQQDNELPVIVSVINQQRDPIQVIEVDFGEVLKLA